MKASWMVGRVAVAVTLLGFAACGSITADSNANRSPPRAMGLNDCATYCGCAQPKSSVAGVGMCSCASPPDGGLITPVAACQCGGWEQQIDSGLGTIAALWSDTDACSSFAGS